MQAFKNSDIKPLPTPHQCAEHKGQVYEFFCTPCQQPVCVHCILASHKDHEYVELKSAFSALKQELHTLIGAVEQDAATLTHASESVKAILKEAPSKEEELKANINASFDTLLYAVQQRRATLLEQVSALFNPRVKTLQLQAVNLDYTSASALDTANMVRKMLESTNQEAKVLAIQAQLKEQLKNKCSASQSIAVAPSTAFQFRMNNLALQQVNQSGLIQELDAAPSVVCSKVESSRIESTKVESESSESQEDEEKFRDESPPPPALPTALPVYSKATGLDDLYELVHDYRLGRQGRVQDFSKAISICVDLASGGHIPAQATCYELGYNCEKDEVKAFELYTLAASQGDALAQWRLARCYEYGVGVERDVVRAAEVYTLAANQGVAEAQYELAKKYDGGGGVDANAGRAVELFTLAANQGHVRAQTSLAVHYANGAGVLKNETRAVELYTLAASAGQAEAQFYLGTRYATGKSVVKNPARALELFKLAAAQGLSIAQAKLKAVGDNQKN